MPRKPRKNSSLCIHHIILRGINQQIIFEDQYDYLQFISILKYYKERCDFKIYAYCLMSNHIHLLLEHTTTDLEIIMKKIEVKLHASLEPVPGTYPWTSYHDYVTSDSSFIDIDKILTLFPSHAACIQYLHTASDQKCMEHYSSFRIPDSEALKIIREKTSCNSPSDFQCLDLATRNQHLLSLHHSGISIRQLSRLTGISRTAINHALKAAHT